MKVMFISDIHGSYYFAKKAIDIFLKERFDKLVILGDILYHGPRNPFPTEYDCMKVSELLNEHADSIIAVKGNCDSEVDQMVLQFDNSTSHKEVEFNGISFYLTHGHIYDEEKLPDLKPGSVLMYGHFHIPLAKKVGNIYVCNPSSISLPKQGTNSYGLLVDNEFSIKTFDGAEVKKIPLTN